MQEKEISNHQEENETASLKELVISVRDWGKYLISKWYIILLVGVVGATLGLVYAFTQKPVYTATTSFVLETGWRSGGLGAYAGIASSLGINVGGDGGSLFEGENILELYKSRSMITQTLLSEAKFNGKEQMLIERYIEFNELREAWEKQDALKNIKFIKSNQYANPKQQLIHDSIMGKIVNNIKQTSLDVQKKDRRLNIINVTVNSEDELFAKAFNEKLVENVNEFYLDTKTKKSLQNVSILQQKTDSVRSILSGSIYSATSIADATPNQNPTRMTQRVAPIQNARVKTEINQEVLGSLLQNLELSKISLLKETPLIQIVDEPILPLEKEKFGKKKGVMIGGLIGGFLILIFLVLRRMIGMALK